MKKSIIVVTLVLLALGLAAAAQAADSGPSLEQLIKDTEFAYSKLSDGSYKVIVDVQDQMTVVVVNEENISDKPETRRIYMYTVVVEVPEGTKPSAAMLRKIAELNGDMLVGNVSFDEAAVFYNSSCWMKNADALTLIYELVLAHKNRIDLGKMLQPFLEE